MTPDSHGYNSVREAMLSFRYQRRSCNDYRGLGDSWSEPSTSIGFPPTLPGFREHDTYQITDAFSYVTDSHSMKFGVELRRTDARLLGILNTRET